MIKLERRIHRFRFFAFPFSLRAAPCFLATTCHPPPLLYDVRPLPALHFPRCWSPPPRPLYSVRFSPIPRFRLGAEADDIFLLLEFTIYRTLSTTAYRPAQPSTVPLAEFAPSRPSSSRPSLDFTVAGAGSPALVKAGQKVQAGSSLVGKSSKVSITGSKIGRVKDSPPARRVQLASKLSCLGSS